MILLAVTSLPLIHGCGGGSDDRQDGARSESLTILYSSDLLGKIRSCGCTVQDSGGLGRRATYYEKVHQGPSEVLTLDAGDIFSLDLSFSKKKAELAMESLSVMGVDVLTPGENDFIFGLPFLQSMAENANFDMVAANVVDPSTGQPVFGKRYVVITLRGGLRVAVTGVLDEKITLPAYIDKSMFDILPVDRTLTRIIPLMKEEADFLVLLSHMGISRTRDILLKVKDFDIAVIGHGMPTTKSSEMVGKTLLLASGGLGQYMGHIDIVLSASGEMEFGEARLVQLSDDIKVHPEIRKIFGFYGEPLTDKEAGTH
jgi:2',3'-cyclic-nucleotide 2'-phosphodiesterase (5'-nucleotidase family)